MGPFPITEKISPIVYCLCLPAELQMHPVINIEHLSQYTQDDLNPQTRLKDLQLLRGEAKYKVDKILGHRYNCSHRHMEYLVQWKGYGSEHDTFKPETHLWNPFLRLRSYRDQLQMRSQSTQKVTSC